MYTHDVLFKCVIQEIAQTQRLEKNINARNCRSLQSFLEELNGKQDGIMLQAWATEIPKLTLPPVEVRKLQYISTILIHLISFQVPPPVKNIRNVKNASNARNTVAKKAAAQPTHSDVNINVQSVGETTRAAYDIHFFSYK